MANEIKFSILVPVYKVENYIAECIESVLNQSYQNFELILVNDGSPDKSGEICDEYAARDERIRVFHKANSGAMHTRLVAVEKACGDYYIIIDSDDYLAPNALEILAENIAKYGADCIIYGFIWLKPGNTEYAVCNEEYCNRLITDRNYAFNIILNDAGYNALWRKCVRANCYHGRDLSPYFHIRSGDDRLMSELVLENAESFLFIPEALYNYRVNTASITHTIRYDGYKADFTVEESNLAMLKRQNVFSEDDYNRLRNSRLDALAIETKRLCRFCSDSKHSVNGLKSIRESSYYNSFLSAGYKACPPLPGVNQLAGLRRALNRLLIALLNARCYKLILFINKYIYR